MIGISRDHLLQFPFPSDEDRTRTRESSAPEAYQKAMEFILCGLQDVVCDMDDVVVFAERESEPKIPRPRADT